MNYKFILDQEWREMMRERYDSDDDSQCSAKRAKTDPEKMVEGNTQPAPTQAPDETPTQMVSEIPPQDPNTEQAQVPPEAPPEPQPEPEKDQATLEKEARNRARDEELERLLYEIPESFHPVPEEFQPMLEQLFIVNSITDEISFHHDVFEQLEMLAQAYAAQQVPQVVEPPRTLPPQEVIFTGVSDDYRPFPHTIVPMYQPVANEYGELIVREEPRPDPYQVYNAACVDPSVVDPCEGTSGAFQYMQPETQMSYEEIPLTFQGQGQQDMTMMSQQYASQLFQMSQMVAPTQMMQPMQATLAQAPTPTLRQLLSPLKPQLSPPQMNPQLINPQQMQQNPLHMQQNPLQMQQNPQQMNPPQPPPPPPAPKNDTPPEPQRMLSELTPDELEAWLNVMLYGKQPDCPNEPKKDSE